MFFPDHLSLFDSVALPLPEGAPRQSRGYETGTHRTIVVWLMGAQTADHCNLLATEDGQRFLRQDVPENSGVGAGRGQGIMKMEVPRLPGFCPLFFVSVCSPPPHFCPLFAKLCLFLFVLRFVLLFFLLS